MKASFNDELKSLLLALLEKDSKKRIGSKDDAAEVKKHPWFSDIDWGKLEKREIEPSFKPDLSTNLLEYFPHATDYVDDGQSDEPNIYQDPENQAPIYEAQNLEGFSYKDESFLRKIAVPATPDSHQ